jgi:hypothetical protein
VDAGHRICEARFRPFACAAAAAAPAPWSRSEGEYRTPPQRLRPAGSHQMTQKRVRTNRPRESEYVPAADQSPTGSSVPPAAQLPVDCGPRALDRRPHEDGEEDAAERAEEERRVEQPKLSSEGFGPAPEHAVEEEH